MANLDAARISDKSLESLSQYVSTILAAHRSTINQLYNKFSTIDYSYFMYKHATDYSLQASGQDIIHGETVVGDIFDDFVIPVVVSQVDSFVGYLAEVYLTGYPMFPVVTTPAYQNEGEKLEAIIDSHAEIGGYGRQLLKSFFNGIKYNIQPLLVDWESLPYYQVATELLKPTEGNKVKKGDYYYNCVRSLDVYNTIWDQRVAPADVARCGEYAGEISLISRVELKRLMNQYAKDRIHYNLNKAFAAAITTGGKATNYMDRPTVNDFISVSKKSIGGSINWLDWVKNTPEINRRRAVSSTGMFERIRLYARIIPSEHGITNVPEPNTPQIWKIDMIAPNIIIGLKRIITFLDMLPIMIGQPLEDDYELQTHSIAERGVSFQEVSSKLLNIRFAGARRAVSDRALYDPNLIRPSDVNSPTAAPKIPVRIPLGVQKTLGDAYHQVPFDNRSTDSVVSDAMNVVELAQMINGSNKATQGQFVKGNKTRKEWDDIMGFTNNRLRLPALMVEQQLISPLKQQLKLNIFQYGVEGVFQNYRTGEPVAITAKDLENIRTHIMAFKAADGYTPSSKIIPTELLTAAINLISTSPILQQRYGDHLPKLFSQMLSVGGIHNLDQYAPETQQPVTSISQPTQGVPNGPTTTIQSS